MQAAPASARHRRRTRLRRAPLARRRDLRRDPQRDHHDQRDPAADGRLRRRRQRGAVALDRVHADDGGRHPDHRLVPAAGHHPLRLRPRDGVFCAGTLLAALAPVFPVLLAARVIQASGTAVMMPLLMTTLMAVVPEHDRGRVMGNVTLAMSVAPALGPAVSGVILQSLSWRWIFLARPARSPPPSASLGLRRLRQRRRAARPAPSTGSAWSSPRSASAAWSTGSARSARPATAPPRTPPWPSACSASAASSGASCCSSARTARCSTCARCSIRVFSVSLERDVGRVHGDARLDDPAASSTCRTSAGMTPARRPACW